ncbi:nucleotide exchange factor GrpE [candidate division WWE3 bacterium RIFCSPLOWO2_01_FULL_42_11]|uniref:Protein GrpE n=1 Tax=candidate division WWE3 bacterium RIFCSPLOWO2_01_FULL_42_11 TaxID=1802627 RepID=A0A1F4VRQ6_UNCKA|nr:MAG: nucleotide exchange factor GrpE [candidate division WWE3 bacterium RIFCSPLOWO2_01_FULL_42_11]
MKETAIKQLEDDLAEMTERWKRAVADYNNLERRNAELSAEIVGRSIAGIVAAFLPTIDQLERAVQHGQSGLEAIYKSTQKTLDDLGVKAVSVVGEIFDPLKHEAVELAEGKEENKILEILEQGYEFGNRLIRPAKVKVSKKEDHNE